MSDDVCVQGKASQLDTAGLSSAVCLCDPGPGRQLALGML